jgi:hypothetical protein
MDTRVPAAWGTGGAAGLDSGGFPNLGKPPLTFSKPWKKFHELFHGS